MSWVLTNNEEDRAIIAEIERESDRGMIIVGVSFLESRLQELIELQMGDEPALTDTKAKLFKGSGPLATFSAKIDLGYVLQFYPETMHKLLHKLRDIRNDAAHAKFAVTFDTPTIRDRCQNLKPLVGSPEFFLHHMRFSNALIHLIRAQLVDVDARVLNDDGTEGNAFGIAYGSAKSCFLGAIKMTLWWFFRTGNNLNQVRLHLPPPPGAATPSPDKPA